MDRGLELAESATSGGSSTISNTRSAALIASANRRGRPAIMASGP